MSPNTTRLQGRTALVTGSTGGLGVAIAKALASQGALVVVSGRNKERGDAVVAEIRATGGRAEFVAADLGAGGDEVHRLAREATAAAGGQIDVLVNNAAVWGMPQPTEEISEETLLESYQANVIAPFLLTGALVPAMAERGHGAVVNVGSINGLIGGDRSALYSSTKAAAHSLTKSWAVEYGPRGVRVNAVAPGPIATERVADIADDLAPVLARVPSRRMSTPEEVAAAVAFLAGEDSGNIHGVVLSVDGGWAAA
ncbi:short-chain dehydrogenase [Mycolicibacterium conceptionense]|uniref:3-oxoacyl-[acyl-carrier-protein] reductase MabA n=1 Tax=Mycolicibacterium conceptionense TaxID=451644 RepID=A0A1A0PS19_9MYCO|nr:MULTISPECIES: SDR family oxidoreductase [Mycolicibacterium]MCW1822430.1 SDR family oxidoreductase [Mycolicibacterium senegalense]OBB12716.1 short-chain dehydrogenase [Mycolicibacterium conceptionense]OBF02467.1 short-chain dehydrogenase [Mycolicibacterium conceptionense]OBF14152.1 short-chain dehydrogenase [Mycolicibacterium conceptionense]OBF42746.1 short-chain dehydrogenase [Mycolicibacterium conceptionense]